MIRPLVLIYCLMSSPALAADSAVVLDDTGAELLLEAPPTKIVSLAPHLTELLFSLGVGDRIVATVRYSDFPDAAKQIPRLGDAFSLSLEAVINLEPDLILAWTTGGNQRTIQRLKELGYPVYLNDAKSLEQIADNVERLGILTGQAERGVMLAADFRQALSMLRAQQGERPATRVFFQIADTQLYTVNDRHLIGQALTACGARNIFGDIELMVPLVSLEAIVAADPEIILVASPRPDFVSAWTADWERLGWQGRIRYVDASLITRPGLRMLKGIKNLCNLL